MPFRAYFPPVQTKKQHKRNRRTIQQRHFQRIFRALDFHRDKIQTPNQHASQIHQGIQNGSFFWAVLGVKDRKPSLQAAYLVEQVCA